MTAEQLWQYYLATLPVGHGHHSASYSAWAFGDRPALADELALLVMQGIKTGTASLMWEYEVTGDPSPQIGEISVILDGREQAVCIIETTSLVIKPFQEVDAEHAYSEGEGDRSLADWRDGHWRFFERVCTQIQQIPTQTMPILCERFRLLYSLSSLSS
ncbi:MAG: ASCH domain-containing protein [Phototrophicaceae bacterium]|jgi:uncharacterized protein YhfF